MTTSPASDKDASQGVMRSKISQRTHLDAMPAGANRQYPFLPSNHKKKLQDDNNFGQSQALTPMHHNPPVLTR